jgi:GDPmannose 4,6-dehydratase
VDFPGLMRMTVESDLRQATKQREFGDGMLLAATW